MIWPERAQYCVHIFEAGAEQPVAVARIFQNTLSVRNSSMRLRRSGPRGWWSYDAGQWWAKAHNRQFDCEARWPIEGERIDATAQQEAA